MRTLTAIIGFSVVIGFGVYPAFKAMPPPKATPQRAQQVQPQRAPIVQKPQFLFATPPGGGPTTHITFSDGATIPLGWDNESTWSGIRYCPRYGEPPGPRNGYGIGVGLTPPSDSPQWLVLSIGGGSYIPANPGWSLNPPNATFPMGDYFRKTITAELGYPVSAVWGP